MTLLKRIFRSRFLWLYWIVAIIVVTMIWPLGGYLFMAGTMVFVIGGIFVALILSIGQGVRNQFRR